MATPSRPCSAGGDLEHLEDDRLVGPEQVAGCDAEQEAVADLAGGSG
jgi:hypothetical protein